MIKNPPAKKIKNKKKKRIHLPMQETPEDSPGSGRSLREGNSNPLQGSCLGNPVDRGAWRAAVRGVAKSPTQLGD